MRRLFVAVAAVLAALVAVAPTSATNVPPGNGLDFVPASPVGVHCEDGGTYSVKVTHNLGKSGWQVESARHYVVGVFTFTVYEGDDPIFSETGTWGVKAGLEPLECWGGFVDEDGNGSTIEATIYPIPENGD